MLEGLDNGKEERKAKKPTLNTHALTLCEWGVVVVSCWRRRRCWGEEKQRMERARGVVGKNIEKAIFFLLFTSLFVSKWYKAHIEKYHEIGLKLIIFCFVTHNSIHHGCCFHFFSSPFQEAKSNVEGGVVSKPNCCEKPFHI